jgi:hypothetical protein
VVLVFWLTVIFATFGLFAQTNQAAKTVALRERVPSRARS